MNICLLVSRSFSFPQSTELVFKCLLVFLHYYFHIPEKKLINYDPFYSNVNINSCIYTERTVQPEILIFWGKNHTKCSKQS